MYHIKHPKDGNILHSRWLGVAKQESSSLIVTWIIHLTLTVMLVGLVVAIVWNVVLNPCRQSITIPLLCVAVLLVIWIWFGVLGITLRRKQCWHTFMFMAVGFLVVSYVYLIFVLRIAGSVTGHDVPGLSYKEYLLPDYSSWFTKQVNNNQSWERYRSCIVNSKDCNGLTNKYENLELESTVLTPIEAGCCRPPSMCGFPAVNASFYNLSI